MNQAGIVPVIFTSSLLYLPTLVAPMLPDAARTWVEINLTSGAHPLYMTAYVVLIAAFAYFYVSITFNPAEVADNLRKFGGVRARDPAGAADRPIPRVPRLPAHRARGRVPGGAGAAATDRVRHPARSWDAAELPVRRDERAHHGGGVGLDTVKQIESQLQQRNYEGFLR
ncbi:hypothetical protein GCM10020001_078770 [Nonomuraea salmonea]